MFRQTLAFLLVAAASVCPLPVEKVMSPVNDQAQSSVQDTVGQSNNHGPVNLKAALSNSTSISSRTSTTIFFQPGSKTQTSDTSIIEPSSFLPGITASIPEPFTSASVSDQTVTVTTPWPSSTTTPLQSVVTETVPWPSTTTPIQTIPDTTYTPPTVPSTGVVTVIDTTVTVYISSGILTVTRTDTVTSSIQLAPSVVTMTE